MTEMLLFWGTVGAIWLGVNLRKLNKNEETDLLFALMPVILGIGGVLLTLYGVVRFVKFAWDR